MQNMLQLHDRTAIQCADREYSYKELSQYAQCYAEAYGPLTKESKVAIFAPNSPEWIFAFYGILSSKAIAVPIDEMSTPEELGYVLKDAYPDIVVTVPERRELVEGVLPCWQRRASTRRKTFPWAVWTMWSSSSIPPARRARPRG